MIKQNTEFVDKNDCSKIIHAFLLFQICLMPGPSMTTPCMFKRTRDDLYLKTQGTCILPK